MADDGAIYLSVVMPAFNEAAGIAEAIRRIEAYLSLKPWRWELLVVDDGSVDGTRAAAAAFEGARANGTVSLLPFEKNQGKGFVVRQGVLAAAGQFVLVTDADLSAPIKESDKLLDALKDGRSDVAVGSRALKEKGCDVRQSLKRKISGRIFNFFVRAIALKGIRDTQCGFKCFTRRAARQLFGAQKLNGFCFDVEILYLAQKKGYGIREVPVMWRQGPRSKVSLVRDSIRMVKDLLKIKRLHAG